MRINDQTHLEYYEQILFATNASGALIVTNKKTTKTKCIECTDSAVPIHKYTYCGQIVKYL